MFSLDCTVIARGETRDGRFVVGPGRLHFQMIDWTELFEMLNASNIVLYLNLSKTQLPSGRHYVESRQPLFTY